MTPENTDLPSTCNVEWGSKYTWSGGSSQMTANADAPLFWGSAPDQARVNCTEFL